MPAPSDILQFMHGQLFETPTLPTTGFERKTVVITGANTGLGFECAKQIAQLKPSILVLGCRNEAKGGAARERILKSLSHGTVSILVWQIDMESFASVKAFARRMQTDLPQKRIDVLLANAGISTNQYHVAEGLESTLTVNVVSTFLLSSLALPMLQETARNTSRSTHLTIVGSNVHCFAAHEQLEGSSNGRIFEPLSDQNNADMAARYFLSKLIVMMGVRQLAKSFPLGLDGTSGVIINSPSPGWCKTDLFRQDDGGFFGRNMLKLIGRTAEVGARTLTSAATAGPETHGQYLSECRVKRISVFLRSEQGNVVERNVWSELEQMLRQLDPAIAGLYQ